MYRVSKKTQICAFISAFIVCSAVAVIFFWLQRTNQFPFHDDVEADSSFSDVADGADSSAIRRLEGWLIIHVVGTGSRCLVKEKRFGRSFRQDFGDTTTASSFLDLYGAHECEEGDVGVAMGKVRAWVLAEAHQKGDECVARVLSNVVATQAEPKLLPRIGLTIGGDADGDALATCDEQ